MVRQEPGTRKKVSKTPGKKFFLREAEDKTGLGLLLLEGPSHVETVLKSTFSDPDVKMNAGLTQILTKVGQEVWPIFRRLGWRSRPHKTIIGQFTFTAPGYTLETAVEGVTMYDTYSSLGKAFLEEGDEKMVERAERGDESEVRSPSDEVQTIIEEEEEETPQRDEQTELNSLSENAPIKMSRARTTSALGSSTCIANPSTNLETVLKNTFSDPEVQVNPSLEPLLNKVGQKVWPIFKKVGWRSRPHKTILGEFTFTAPGFTLEAATEGITKYNTFSALGKSFLEEGDEKMLGRARIRPKISHRKKTLDEREHERIESSPLGDKSFQGRTFLEEGDEKMLGRPPRNDTIQRKTLLDEKDEEISIDRSRSLTDGGRAARHTKKNSTSMNIDIRTDVLEDLYGNGGKNGLCAVTEVPSIDGTDSIEFMSRAPIPLTTRARSTPNPTYTGNLDNRLKELEKKMLARLKEDDNTATPSPTETPSTTEISSTTDEAPFTNEPSTTDVPSIMEDPSPIEIVDLSSQKETPSTKTKDPALRNGRKKTSLNTRVEAMEELVFDDGQTRDGRIVSRIKEMEQFIFDADYAPPKNLTGRVNALAQEFELDF